jgi:hypothetical protein
LALVGALGHAPVPGQNEAFETWRDEILAGIPEGSWRDRTKACLAILAPAAPRPGDALDPKAWRGRPANAGADWRPPDPLREGAFWLEVRDAQPNGEAYAEALAKYFETKLLQEEGSAPWLLRGLLHNGRLEACDRFLGPLAERIRASAAEGAAVSIPAALGLTEDDLSLLASLAEKAMATAQRAATPHAAP